MDAEEVRELARLARVDEVYYGRRPRPALTLVPKGGE
jgi:hypothetical protein